MKLQAYSAGQVKALLTHLMVFSSANNNQGLSEIKGTTFEEKINTIMERWEEWIDTPELQSTKFPTYLGWK